MSDTTTGQPPASPPTLCAVALQDVEQMLNIITVCATRGAFRVDDFTAVAALRDRLQNVSLIKTVETSPG